MDNLEGFKASRVDGSGIQDFEFKDLMHQRLECVPGSLDASNGFGILGNDLRHGG